MSVNAQIVSAGDALDVLAAGWEAQRSGGLTASWMLHGRPGVGKTEVVRTLADRIGAELVDIRLTTIEPQDLRGLPYYDHDRKRTVWYRPEDLPDNPDRPSILFLDELTAASPHLQPTVYGLLQERRVGRHALQGNTFIVAAGNTVDDGAIAYEMGAVRCCAFASNVSPPPSKDAPVPFNIPVMQSAADAATFCDFHCRSQWRSDGGAFVGRLGRTQDGGRNRGCVYFSGRKDGNHQRTQGGQLGG